MGRKRRKKGKPVPIPSRVRKLTSFTVSAIGHAFSGFPTCTQEEIDDRLHVCHNCPSDHFIPTSPGSLIGACEMCGCKVHARKRRFLSKLAWKDRRCPLRYWSGDG